MLQARRNCCPVYSMQNRKALNECALKNKKNFKKSPSHFHAGALCKMRTPSGSGSRHLLFLLHSGMGNVWFGCPSAQSWTVSPAQALGPRRAPLTRRRYNEAETGWLTGPGGKRRAKAPPPFLPPFSACRCMQSRP